MLFFASRGYCTRLLITVCTVVLSCGVEGGDYDRQSQIVVKSPDVSLAMLLSDISLAFSCSSLQDSRFLIWEHTGFSS